MKRRECLKLAGIAAGVALIDPAMTLAAVNNLAFRHRHFGLQLYTIREELKEDPVQALEAVANMGFKEVEMFGFGGNPFISDPLFGLSARQFKQALDDSGLTVLTTHVSGDVDVASVADLVHELGIKYLVVAMAPEFIARKNEETIIHGVTGVDQIQTIADRLNKQGLMCKENGLALAYHNHHLEFTPLEALNDTLAFDFLMQQADPELVKIEFDVGWLAGAKVDPVEYLTLYRGRVIATHLKDFNPNLPIGQDLKRYPIPIMTQMAVPGTGTVDFKAILVAMDEAEVSHGFVEIDITDKPMVSVRRSLDYLQKIAA